MDWLASGLKNTFEYELVDVFDLDSSLGFLEGVTGGTINETYSGDYRSGLTLEVDDAEIPLNAMVRVWHVAELDGEQLREEMGTFMLDSRPMEYRYGRYTGSLSLQSSLYRLGMDRRVNDAGVAAGTLVNSKFESVVKNAGGTPLIPSSFSATKEFSSAHVWEAGDSCLSECHTCAAAMSPRGYVMPDSHGRVTVEAYRVPSQRTPSFTIGSDSLLIGVTEDDAEICNKVCVSATVDGVDYFASASVATTHPWSFNNIGYWAAKTYTASDIEGTASEVQAALQSLASTYLANNSDVSRTFSVQALYSPLHVGDAGLLDYSDSPDGDGIKATVWLKQRTISLDASMVCELTLVEVI